jgi:hypothetical protein
VYVEFCSSVRCMTCCRMLDFVRCPGSVSWGTVWYTVAFEMVMPY